MAFQPANSRQDVQNRKILEDLLLKKQMLLKQGVVPTLSTSSINSPVLPAPSMTPEQQQISIMQRNAMSLAAQSYTYYITTDSTCGNPILPVIPRFDNAHPNWSKKCIALADITLILEQQAMACIKRKHLEEYLQDIEVFQNPKVDLEQYPTTPHIGSHMLHSMESMYGDLSGKLVADLGCGCGSLSMGAALLGAGHVVGYEIDPAALEIWTANKDDLEVSNCDAVLCDITKELQLHSSPKQFNTVIMNPPFGTKRKGVDMEFLQAAINLADNAVYSLHKTSTRAHVLAKAEQWGAKGAVIAELRFDLPASYRFHKKLSVDIEVDFIRFTFPKNRKSCK